MSKNRDLANIVGPDAETGDFLNYNSDGTLSFSNIPADITSFSGYTISADADPAATTNPGYEGALWLNQSTGEFYVCTDATTDANVWLVMTFETPVDIFQGSNFGFTSGGNTPSNNNIIDKFPFASDFSGTASDVGDLTLGRLYGAGQSSSNYAYTSGGYLAPAPRDIIDKFPFASDGDATDAGDLSQARGGSAGQSSSEYAYTSGGANPTATSLDPIDKFPFAADWTGTATDVGDLTVARRLPAGQSSTENGYTSGGLTPTSNVIDRFPFASDANATDVGDLSVAKYLLTGQSSTDNGYTSGGNEYPLGPTNTNLIEKFPFAADWTGTASDVADLTVTRASAAGQSSTESGYTSGGNAPPAVNIIDKFPFSSDGNATDAGDLSVSRYYAIGQQY